MPEWNRQDFERFYNMSAEPWGHPNTRPGVRLHYHNWPIGQYQSDKYAPMLASTIGLNSGDSVVLVGCGFNWTARGLAAAGADVIGIDVSTYVNAEKGNTEEAEIRDCLTRAGLDPDTDVIPTDGGTVQQGVAGMNYLDVYLEGGRAAPATRGWGTIAEEDMGSRPSRRAVRNALSSDPRFIISEEMINSVTDQELLVALDYVDSFFSEEGIAGTQIIHMVSPLQEDHNQAPELNWKTYQGWRDFLDTNGFTEHKLLPTVTAVNQGMGVDGRVEAYSGLI